MPHPKMGNKKPEQSLRIIRVLVPQSGYRRSGASLEPKSFVNTHLAVG